MDSGLRVQGMSRNLDTLRAPNIVGRVHRVYGRCLSGVEGLGSVLRHDGSISKRDVAAFVLGQGVSKNASKT